MPRVILCFEKACLLKRKSECTGIVVVLCNSNPRFFLSLALGPNELDVLQQKWKMVRKGLNANNPIEVKIMRGIVLWEFPHKD